MTKPAENSRLSPLLYGPPHRADRIALLAAGLVCFFAFFHPDIQETARHAYILIRSSLDGDFLQFFEITLQRSYGYAYTNAAHYHILFYLVYALWELPLYLIEQLFHLAFSDLVLSVWCKTIGVGFYLGCGILTGRLARQLGCSEQAAGWAPLLFWLNPISFFTINIMGQYDSICLFFLLWALTFYFRGRLVAFTLLMGAGLVFKFFPLVVFLPLLLLAEKRPGRVLGHLALSLWLYLPGALLFAGRTGDAGFFNSLMARRLFAQVFPGGVMNVSCIGLGLVLLCALAWLLRPKDDGQRQRWALYLALCGFGVLFLFVYWHPQWLILLAPFLLLTTLQQKSPSFFFFAELALYIGFFILCALLFPDALEANLFNAGPFAPLGRAAYYACPNPRNNAFYFGLIPYLSDLAPILFYGGLLCSLLFKLPVGKGSLADRLCGGQDHCRFSLRLYGWGGLVLALGGFWAFPTLFSYLKTCGVL